MVQIVTKIEKQTKRDRYNIYLDGVYSFSLAAKVLDDVFIKKGDQLTNHDIEAAKQADIFSKAFDNALNILSYRSHSQKEISDKLSKKYETPVIDKVIEKLKATNLINDNDFTERYIEQSKKGKKLVKLDLLKRGVDKDLIEKYLENKDEDLELENARKISEQVLKKYEKKDKIIKKKKLYETLTRKGFSYDIYKQIIQKKSF